MLSSIRIRPSIVLIDGAGIGVGRRLMSKVDGLARHELMYCRSSCLISGALVLTAHEARTTVNSATSEYMLTSFFSANLPLLFLLVNSKLSF